MSLIIDNGELDDYPVKTTLDGLDNVQHINVDILPAVSGSVAVTNLPATQPVSAVALPLPSGAATEAKQLPDNHQVSVSNFPASQAVTAEALPLPSGAATAAKQLADNHNVTVSNLPATQAISAVALPLPAGAATETTLSSLNGKVTACNTGAIAGTVAVSNLPASQAITAVSLPLPTDAATSALQTSGNASLSSIDGKITACNTGAVAVASSALPAGAATETTLLELASLNRIKELLTAIARLSYSTTGLRVDATAGTLTIAISANQSLLTVAGLGFNTAQGQASQQSDIAFQNGFRRNLVVT